MKKVIFISALAIAAAVSCTKSDIVDTKFNEQISFESYIGRDAMTKAGVTNRGNIGNIAIYGFYLGNSEATWSESSVANLWENVTFTGTNGTYTTTQKKYWTNDTDKYAFFAYAPAESNLAVASATEKKNPKVTFTVEDEIADQKDFVYSNNLKSTWKTKTDATKLEFKHALSRINVTASTTETSIQYIIKKVDIKGKFNTQDVLTLNTGLWQKNGQLAQESTTFNVFTHDETVITKDNVADFALSNTNFAGTEEDNYLMVIPTNFDATPKTEGEVTTYPDACEIEIQYTTWYEGQESGLNVKSFPFGTDFQQGKAYTFNFVFQLDANNEIKFTVDVEGWTDAAAADQPDTIYPEGQPAQE